MILSRSLLVTAAVLLSAVSALAQTPRSLRSPVITAVSRNTRPSVTAGEHVGFSFKNEPGSESLFTTRIRVIDPTGTERIFERYYHLAGSIVLPTRADWPLGRYTVSSVSVEAYYREALFHRDGTVTAAPMPTTPLPFPIPTDFQIPTSHALKLASLDFELIAPAAGTVISGMLTADTRWSLAGSPYRLTGNIVVPAGVTLTIDPGVRVIGDARTIEVAGTLEVLGQLGSPTVLSNVTLLPTNAAANAAFLIKLQHTAMYGGAVWPATFGEVYGTLQLRDSVFVDVAAGRATFRYPRSELVVERNIFYHSSNLTVGTASGGAPITIRNNLFHVPDMPEVTRDRNPGAISVFALGAPITIRGNSFVSIDGGYALQLTSGLSAQLDATGNFIDQVTFLTNRAAYVSGGAGSITILPMLATPDPATPTLAPAPAFDAVPGSQEVAVGAPVTLTASATGTGEVWYQWYKDGVALPGATDRTLVLPAVEPRHAGTYTVSAADFAGTATSTAAVLTVSGSPLPLTSWLSNVSVRTALQAGHAPVLVGFATNGAKSILVRAAGPTLADHGVGSSMADPRIALHAGNEGTPVVANDDWEPVVGTLFGPLGAFPFRAGSKDAALLQTIQGTASAHASGSGAGIILVEAYDADPSTGTTRLVNVSARNHVGTGGEVLITGFVVHGTGTKRLLIRGVGPKLTDYSVTGVLADPKLEVFNAAGVRIATNDNWDASLASTFLTTGAFPLSPGSKDAALLVTLAANASYSVQLSGSDGGTGQALVEVYEVP